MEEREDDTKQKNAERTVSQQCAPAWGANVGRALVQASILLHPPLLYSRAAADMYWQRAQHRDHGVLSTPREKRGRNSGLDNNRARMLPLPLTDSIRWAISAVVDAKPALKPCTHAV